MIKLDVSVIKDQTWLYQQLIIQSKAMVIFKNKRGFYLFFKGEEHFKPFVLVITSFFYYPCLFGFTPPSLIIIHKSHVRNQLNRNDY